MENVENQTNEAGDKYAFGKNTGHLRVDLTFRQELEALVNKLIYCYCIQIEKYTITGRIDTGLMSYINMQIGPLRAGGPVSKDGHPCG